MATKSNKLKTAHPAETQATETGGLSIFKKASEVNLGDFQELTSPPIVRMRDMKIGDVLDGKILAILPSQRKDIKNPLVVLELTGSDGVKVSVPGQAVITSTLLPDYDGDKPEHRENPQKLCPYVGRRLFIKLTGHKFSNQWKDDQDKPRKYPVYDIAVARK